MVLSNLYKEAKEKLIDEIENLQTQHEEEESLIRVTIQNKDFETNAIQMEVNESESKMSVLKDEIKKIIEKKENYSDEIRALEEKIDGLNTQMTEKHFEIHGMSKSNDMKLQKMEKLENEKNKLRDELDKMVAENVERVSSLSLKTENIRDNQSDSSENSCAICFEAYNKEDHYHSCITLCGHRFGLSCLEKLQAQQAQACCPICNKNFQACNVIKLF